MSEMDFTNWVAAVEHAVGDDAELARLEERIRGDDGLIADHRETLLDRIGQYRTDKTRQLNGDELAELEGDDGGRA